MHDTTIAAKLLKQLESFLGTQVVQSRESNWKGRLSRWRIELKKKKDRERKRREKQRKKARPIGVVVRNLETGDVLHAGDGKGVKAPEGFAKRIRRWRRHIRHVCMDMANACAKRVGECLPDAETVFDRFHVIKAMNDRLDKIRRRTMSKADDGPGRHVKGNRHLLTGNAEDPAPDGRARLAGMRCAFSELSDAHGPKERLRGIYEVAQHEFGARLPLGDRCATARATGVPGLVSMADTVERHLDGIPGYWKHGRAGNAKTGGFNNKIRWLIRQAYGFGDRECFKLKIYALPDTETTKSP